VCLVQLEWITQVQLPLFVLLRGTLAKS